MTKRLTLELSDLRATQLAHVSQQLRLTPEQALHLALNLCMAEWKEIMPELVTMEAEAEAEAAAKTFSALRH